MTDRPTPLNFIKAFRSYWFAAMSGGFSVPFACAAVFLENNFAKSIFLATAFFGAWFAAHQLWKNERNQACDLGKKLESLTDEYAHALRVERIDLEEQRGFDRHTNKLKERKGHFAIRLRNTLNRPIGYSMRDIVLNGDKQRNFLTTGSIISALSETTFYTEVKELDLDNLEGMFSVLLEFNPDEMAARARGDVC